MNTPSRIPSHEHFSADDWLELTADDAGMRRGLHDIFVEEAPKLLARIDDALAHGQSAVAADAAHALRSLVATVGGRRAFALAGDFERRARAGDLSSGRDTVDALGASLHHLGAALRAFIEREDSPC